MHFVIQFSPFFTSAFSEIYSNHYSRRKYFAYICIALLYIFELGTIRVKCDSPNSNKAASQSSLPDSSYNGCDATKTCFGLEDCILKKSCRILLAGRKLTNKDIVEFELYGKYSDGTQSEWFAMALSHDQQMGDDSVTECIVRKGTQPPVIQESWNSGQSNEKYNNVAIKHINKENGNGFVKCVWQRNITTTVNGKTFDLSQSYVLLAAGFADENGIRKFKHNLRGYSDNVVNFNAASTVASGKIDFLVKIHGSLMVLIWLGMVSVGIMIARHYKNVWREKLLGEKVWFTCHRGLMVISIALAVISMICIFTLFGIRIVTVHSYFGVLANSLMFLQAIGGYFRPHPGTQYRWMFSWAHWFGGNVAQLSAIIAMFLAAYLPAAGLPSIFVWFLVIFVIFHTAVHVIMQMHAWNLISKRKESIPLSSSNVDTAESYTDHGESFKKLVLGTYIVLLSLITLALIIVILSA